MIIKPVYVWLNSVAGADDKSINLNLNNVVIKYIKRLCVWSLIH